MAMLGVFLGLANYIVLQNRTILEQAWTPKEFFKMICVSGVLSSATQLLWRVTMFGINKNEESYKEFRYASINIMVIALLLGLC